MSTETILLYAIGVFVLMSIGIVLTMLEFNRISDEPSQRKGGGAPKKMSERVKSTEQESAKVRVVYSKEDAA